MRTSPNTLGRSVQRGMSLVELMIAMTVGLIALAGVGYLYLESRQAFRSIDNLSRMQETARYAMEILSRDLRMAGYRGCASSSVSLTNTLNNAAAFGYDFGTPINGFDASGGGWSPSLPSGAGGLSGLSVLAGTDAITLRGAFGGGTTVTDQPGNSSADLKVTTPNDLQIDDIVMVTDCVGASVFQITNFNVTGAAQNVVHNTGGASPGNATKDLGRRYVSGEIVKMQSKTYFIRNGANGRPALWQFDNYRAAGGDNPAEIAEGVENMQIQYGIDANADGVVESYSSGGGVANWNQVAAVRISLLVAGNDDKVASAKQTYTYDGASVTAADQRLRQVFTTTISVRNKTQ